MKKTFPVVLFFLSLSIYAQNLDSLYNEFIRIKTGNIVDVKQKKVTATNEEVIKCGFGIVNSIKTYFSRFDPEKQQTILKLSTRPNSDTSFVTPGGNFRIHYFKSGINAPGYDLNELAEAADSAYNYEVNILGYPPPPNDLGANSIQGNPDNLYDIYIQNLASNLYGYTEADEDLGDSKFTSYLVIDNDFSNYYSKGINGAKVTIAHEMHHGIQIGNYIFSPEDTYYHEITSTSMEEFVFDDINDYYHDLAFFMWNPQRGFASNNGYNLAIWNIFLSDEFDKGIIKRIWELMPQKRALFAMAEAVSERDSSFKNEFAKFGLWIYFTGSRALPGKYFEEAENYPLVNPFMSVSFSKPETTVNVNSEPVSTNIIIFTDNTGSEIDTFTAIISNVDFTNGVENQSSITNFKYFLSNQPLQDYRFVVDGYYSKIESAAGFLLTETNILNNLVIDNGQVTSKELEYPYPQPFRYSQSDVINFPVSINQSRTVELYVYSVDMNLVYSGVKNVLGLDNVVIQWDGKDNSNNKLGSGIYFFVIKSGDSITKGKFAVFND